ncbi:MAG: hypothetical protein WB689_29685, partial [Xanthobacteraceae bacterium]
LTARRPWQRIDRDQPFVTWEKLFRFDRDQCGQGALGNPIMKGTPPIIERFVSRILADVQFQRFR